MKAFATSPTRSAALMVAGAVAVTLLMNIGLVGETLHGRFADPDDAMRLVEVRAWLAGQSWFDLNAARLDPPHGSFMHWSRLVDLPAAVMIELFGLATSRGTAERLMEIAVPLFWLAALYAGMLRLATLLVGPAGRLPILIGTILSGTTLVQFAPGRIGHHAPETVMLVWAVGAACAALDPRRAREALVCGLLVALSLTMSLETLPFNAALVGILVGLWVWRGPDLARSLAWLGTGLVLALPALFVVTIGPARWGAPVCDAYGAAHLGAGLIGAAGALALGRMTSYLRSRPRRAAAAMVVAAFVIAFVAVAYPACLRSPFAGVDPLVRDLWLDHVVESLPLLEFLRTRPMITLAIVGPMIFGLIGSAAAAIATQGIVARRFTLIAVMTAFGLALACWQVRVVGSITPIALCGAVFLVVTLGDRLAIHGLKRLAAIAPMTTVALTSTAWVIALPDDAHSSDNAKAIAAKNACLAPDALTPLAGLPKGAVVGPVDSGSYILEATKLSVFAAPYHRNNDGNRFAFDVFLGTPEVARALLASRHVSYVITCPGTNDMKRLIDRAPDGLAAKLDGGDVPAFLTRLPLAGTPYKVYAVRPDGNDAP